MGCSFGCDLTPSAERREFSRIDRAIDELRQSENADKRVFLERLRKVPCATMCALRDSCLRAYEAHVRGLHLIEGARGGAPTAEKLDEAERALSEARRLTEQCVALQGEERRERRR